MIRCAFPPEDGRFFKKRTREGWSSRGGGIEKISIPLKHPPAFYTSLSPKNPCEIHLTEFIKSNTIFLGSNVIPIFFRVTSPSLRCWENEINFWPVRGSLFSIDREKIREFLKSNFKGRKRMAEEKAGGDAWDSTQWHVVKKGESLWKIAEQYYGDGNLYKKIFEANQDILSDPNLIKVGQKLRIP